MTLLQALKILEDAVRDCKGRDIDTADVREALDLLEPQIRPNWLVVRFRSNIGRSGNADADLEQRQQVLRVTFPGIRDAVREILRRNMDKLARRYAESRSKEIKAEFERVSLERGKLQKPWKFVAK
jgi:hypothetical protein